MIMNLLIGCTTMIVCLAIQCAVVSLFLRVVFVMDRRDPRRSSYLYTTWLLIVTMLTMLVGNVAQMILWALLFVVCGEFKEFGTAFYHSVVNFATLGYGDIVMSEKRRLLGALEAANGVLMFGMTSGFVFSIIHELAQRAWDRLDRKDKQTKDDRTVTLF